MKIKINFIAILLFLLVFPKEVFATETDYYVRVGLKSSYLTFDELDIGTSNIKVGYKLEGDTKGSYAPNTRGVDFSGFTSPKISQDSNSYVQLSISFSNFFDAEAYCSELKMTGFSAIVAMTDIENYTVLLGPFTDANAGNIEMEKYTSLYSQKAMLVNHGNMFNLSDDGVIKLVFISSTLQPQVCDLNNEPFYISYSYIDKNFKTVSDKDKYRGIIEVQKNADRTLRAINLVKLEEYLYSVVPSEMPSSWESEALKTQAVAARNYVFTQKAHSDDGYNVCDTTHCQVYNGYSSENERTTKAVKDTSGILAYYDGVPINAFFSSSSGGATANSEDVWVNVVPYLRAVDDSYDTTGKTWTRQFTQEQLTTAAKAYGQDVGKITSVVATKKDSFGRVIDLTFTGESGSFVVSKDKIRGFFLNYDYSLDSTLFTITNSFGEVYNKSTTALVDVINKSSGVVEVIYSNIYIVNSNSTSQINTDNLVVLGASGALNVITKDEYTATNSGGNTNILELTGKGWGHGVGMSQHGSNGMAKAGYTYDQILKHYYTGIELH